MQNLISNENNKQGNYEVLYKVAMYLRLSSDDGDNSESESISNQRMIIMDYINKHPEMQLYDEYVDDGYSGANFNRPGFKRMIKDIENKKINMVVTKNLARFGRNYIDSGLYIQKYFPDHRVRYLAILDNIDNFDDDVNNDFMPIKSVFNEKHCKDTSIAVKKSKRKRMQEGIYACSIAPFGYKKDPNNNGKLIVDEESSKTVKKIFELRLMGYSVAQIVSFLDDNHYQTPAEYLNVKVSKKVTNKNIWKKNSVIKILCNEVYLGHCIRGKTQNISYKTKKKLYINKNDCIRVNNTHEAIISEEIFYKVHDNKKYGLRRKMSEIDYLFKGFIYCKECGRKIVCRNDEKKVTLFCKRNTENPKLCSNDCRIDYSKLEKQILQYIEIIYSDYFSNPDYKNSIYRNYIENILDENKENLKKKKKELDVIKEKISSLYRKKLYNAISESEYKEIYSSLLNQRQILQNEVSKKELILCENEEKLTNIDKKTAIFEKISKVSKEDFSKDDVRELINKIELYKNEAFISFNFEETKQINF